MSRDGLRNVITYRSNNSGGSWWLTDENWLALEAAGWIVHWNHDRATAHGDLTHPKAQYESGLSGHSHAYEDQLVAVEASGERWMGALATSAAKATTDPAAAVAEFERVTGMCASDEGCHCCGEPHSFTFYDEDGKSRYSNVEIVVSELRWSS